MFRAPAATRQARDDCGDAVIARRIAGNQRKVSTVIKDQQWTVASRV